MKIVILSSLGNERAKLCLDSLMETAPVADFDLYLFREKGFREQTLNHALENVGTDDDILFIGDDITFTHGWHEALTANLEKAQILGMSMLYTNSSMVQDCGYDLMGDKSLLEPLNRGQDHKDAEAFGFRFCDAVCGCFLYIKAEVFTQVSAFSEKGVNRWGEFILIAEARRAGFTCGVIDHYLYHGGISTKNNPDKKLSSASYLVEHGWWMDIVHEFVDPSWVQAAPKNHLDESLTDILTRKSSRVLVYGAGTVAEFILNHLGEKTVAEIEFCSGLSEEIGMTFLGRPLQDAGTIDLSAFDTILMTPLHMGEGLFHHNLKPRLPTGFQGDVFYVETQRNDNILEYRALEIPVRA